MMVQKDNVIFLEEVLLQAGVVNCHVVLKEPVIIAQTRDLSQERCLLQHVYIASRRFDAPAEPAAPLLHSLLYHKQHSQAKQLAYLSKVKMFSISTQV